MNAHNGTLSYTENQAPAAIDAALTVSDVDSTNLSGATVSITGNFHSGEDVLGFTDQGSIHGSYNASTGVMTLTGSATVAQYQAALDAVTYSNSSDNPSGDTRTISYQVDDGSAQNNLSIIDTSTVSVTPVNDAPVNTVPGAQTVAENGSLVFDAAHAGPISISDVDANGGKETVVLTAGDGTLTLSQTSNLHFIVGTNGSGSMIIEGTLNDLDAALNGLTYTPNHNFTGSDSISITTLDEGNTGSGGQQADSKSIAITVTATGTAPVVTESLAHDTGTLSNDSVTSDPTVTGTGDAIAVPLHH